MYRNLSLLLAVVLTMGLQSCYHDPRPEIRTNKTCSNDRFLYIKGDRFLALPTAFTPNGDGVNDAFIPMTNMNPDSFSVRVMDPGGKELYVYTPDQSMWHITDTTLLNNYQYYVDVTVLDPEAGEINTCSPLFLLVYDKKKGCIPDTHPEDRERYFFPDQFSTLSWDEKLPTIDNKFCPQ